jgi:hypothetical protein
MAKEKNGAEEKYVKAKESGHAALVGNGPVEFKRGNTGIASRAGRDIWIRSFVIDTFWFVA